MYFNRKVILQGLTILSLSSDVLAGNCPQSVVKAGSDGNFLEYALVNCVGRGIAAADKDTNILGKPVLDAQACVAAFSATLNTSGECLNDYLVLVSSIQDRVARAVVSPFSPGVGGDEGCKYDTNNGIRMSYICWQRIVSPLLDFYNSAGYPVYIAPCDPIQVRSQTLVKLFPNAVKDTLSAYLGIGAAIPADYSYDTGSKYIVASPWAKTTTGYKASVDLQEAMCLGSYQVILDMLQGRSGAGAPWRYSTFLGAVGLRSIGTDAAGPNAGWLDATAGTPLTSLMTACRTDPTSATCANSPAMSGIKSLFANLSGFDVAFSGPICAADVISKNIDQSGIRPTPYQFFVMCGLLASQNPQTCSSDSIAQYISALKNAIGSDCLGCYDEMSTTIAALVADETTTGACNSFANITSDACVAALSPVATAFKQCTGSDLYTQLPSSLPSNSTNSSVNTTNGTASNAAEIHGSRAFMNSGVLIALAVLVYLM